VTSEHIAETRAFHWQLGVHLHRRLYHDIGLEIDPGTLAIRTPYCDLGNRYLGNLRAVQPGRVMPSGAPDMSAAFEQLNTESWLVRRHLGCFHRRAKACYDLIFEIATALAVELLPGARVALVNSAYLGPGRPQLCGPVGKPHRIIKVTTDSASVACRSDGLIVGASGYLDARAVWRRGSEPRQIAETIAGGL
jgi:hypothetical protein